MLQLWSKPMSAFGKAMGQQAMGTGASGTLGPLVPVPVAFSHCSKKFGSSSAVLFKTS